jgi:hypothetical protein
MVQIFPQKTILEAIEWNSQLTKKDKEFSRFILSSDFLCQEYFNQRQ